NTATDSNDHDIIDIYDENEEMMPTIDTESAESEEVSEDNIAFESEYERMMEEFNEGDEYEGDRGGNENESDEETSEEASDEEIIDQPLNNEQLPHFTQSNEFNPYFNNITESLNSSLATQAYDELVDIIRHPQFKKDD
ncbi:5353_t:CDS:2, partial [Rhizophagus irregularis]